MMRKLTKDPTPCGTNRAPLSPRSCEGRGKGLWILPLAAMLLMTMLSACGSGAKPPGPLLGNWQFSMDSPTDSSGNTLFAGGLQGGFLQQQNGAVTGSVFYLVSQLSGGVWAPCANGTGTATIAGTISDYTVTLSDGQNFNLTGTVSLDGSTMSGTYTLNPSTTLCGTSSTTGSWSWRAMLVPPITGTTITGSFHSTGGAANLDNQDFPVTGTLTQAANTGASAAITGTLSFSDYPCLGTAPIGVSGTISGNSVSLTIASTDASNNPSQIGVSDSFPSNSPVTFDPTTSGYVLHSLTSEPTNPAYVVNSPACPTVTTDTVSTPGDSGDICLALGSATTCQQPFTLTPASLEFGSLEVGQSPPATQSLPITLTNSGTSTLNFSVKPISIKPVPPAGSTDFTESDNCPTQDGSLLPERSCIITITFSPKNSYGSCGYNLTSSQTCVATLKFVSPAISPDNDTSFAVPLTGTACPAAGCPAPSSAASDIAPESGAEALPDSSHSTFQNEEQHAETH